MPKLSSGTFSHPKNFFLLKFLLVVAVLLRSTHAVPIQNEFQALFGQLISKERNLESGNNVSQDILNESTQELQGFAGINGTETLDPKTNQLMITPEYESKDKVSSGTRSKRYVPAGSRWTINDITYKISKYPKSLDKASTDKAVADAFNLWAEVTPLTFTQKKIGQVNIEIRFESGHHGDNSSFEQGDPAKAHGFYPQYGSSVHFNDDEEWTANTENGTNLFQVATHEFGHALGLKHSEVSTAVMEEKVKEYNPSFKLDKDDVEGIQALYGIKENPAGSGGGRSRSAATDESTRHTDQPSDTSENVVQPSQHV